jgi:hypothetical protein
MKKLVAAIALLSFAICVAGPQAAEAHDPTAPPPMIVPPPPPPPPMDIPKIPKMGELPTSPKAAAPSPRGSFDQRMHDCTVEGAAKGLGPNERSAYSRACALSR